ncbi:hypothetical protein EON82_18680 [bacterium]|nr:MAG: hypothetical protein EON82_18680 [bacterium]
MLYLLRSLSMFNRKIATACLLVASLATSFGIQRALEARQASPSSASTSPLDDRVVDVDVEGSEEGRHALESAAARTREFQRNALEGQAQIAAPLLLAVTPVTRAQPERHDKATVVAVERNVVEMLAAQGLYNAEATREKQFDAFLTSPKKLAVLEDALKDETFARSSFGKFQAEARYFASQALQKAARAGDDEPLLRAVNAIGREAHAGLSEGRKQDLEELLLGWARSKSPEFFENPSSDLPATLGFDQTLPADVRSIYKDSVYMALYRKIGMDRAQQTVDRLFVT